MAIALEFENVSKEYRGFLRRQPVRALDDFSLRVEAGEIFGFLGPNGSGKTTAIHIAMGFSFATRGSGHMLGHPFGHAAIRRRVGFLGENVALYHRPATKLVRFYGALNGMRDPELRDRTRATLEGLDLAAWADRDAGKFSRGMQQRVGLAQALVNDPDLLVLDEPMSALDPHGRVAVRELLLRAKAAGKTIFLSSHLLTEIELICDRVALLHRGRIVRAGATAELLAGAGQLDIVVGGLSLLDLQALSSSVNALDDGTLRLRVPSTQQRDVIQRIWTLGGEVVSLNPSRRALEELFLELTSASDSRPGRLPA